MVKVLMPRCLRSNGSIRGNCRAGSLSAALLLSLVSILSMAEEVLRVEKPRQLAISVSRMTRDAARLGLTDTNLAALVGNALEHAGVRVVDKFANDDKPVLFLDVVVEGESFFVSLDFMRPAVINLPGGSIDEGPVSVWQDYVVGTHVNDAGAIRHVASMIVGRFVASYFEANGMNAHSKLAMTE